jgi:hypothetical protein
VLTAASVREASQIAATTFTIGMKHKMQNNGTDFPFRAAMKPITTTYGNPHTSMIIARTMKSGPARFQKPPGEGVGVIFGEAVDLTRKR